LPNIPADGGQVSDNPSTGRLTTTTGHDGYCAPRQTAIVGPSQGRPNEG